jgi:hypothetical protein
MAYTEEGALVLAPLTRLNTDQSIVGSTFNSLDDGMRCRKHGPGRWLERCAIGIVPTLSKTSYYDASRCFDLLDAL